MLPSVPFALTVLGIITVALIVGSLYSLKVINDVKNQMSEPFSDKYSLAIARFPDALILQFGYEKKFRDIPASLKINYVPWGSMLNALVGNFVTAIYGNRRTAAAAIRQDPNITVREKTLCIYRGFSICLISNGMSISNEENYVDSLRHHLNSGVILVRSGTDQHDALIKLCNDLKISDPRIREVPPDEDILETAIKAKSGIFSGSSDAMLRDIVGFAAGITERVIAEKIGFTVIAEQSSVLKDYIEINSFVYTKPTTHRITSDLVYVLDEVEKLWDETLSRIFSERECQEEFRIFLNEQLQSHIGQYALKELGGREMFSPEDMKNLLTKWLEFPDHVRPVSIVQWGNSGATASN